MTTPIKTQCPHCHTCFKVQQTQLNQVNAAVHCDQCQQSFLVNKHLVVNADTSHDTIKKSTVETQADKPRTHKTSKQTKPSAREKHTSDTLIHDGLIHDDMDIDEPEESILEYDSLDSMDAWLTQASHSAPIATPDKRSNTHKSDTTKKPHRSTASSLNASPVTNANPAPQSVLSSTAANDIHANIDNKDDNSWLEKLLEEQSKREEEPVEDTDLSQLLIDLGVPTKDEGSAFEEQLKKSQRQFAPTPTSRSIATILWLLGCLVLALLLAAQYVIFNLETLVKDPVQAQRLQAVCSVAACSLPSADLTVLSINELAHRSSRINTAGTFSDISATLNNQGVQAQLYPNIKVSVYGNSALIGEFVAVPDDYLLGKHGQLAAGNNKPLLFTIPVANAQIDRVTMTALY